MSLKSAYIITKPLQYVNATNITDLNAKNLFVVDNFNNADKFIESIKIKSSHWDKIFIFKKKEFALINIIFNRSKYDKIFLDSDFGLSVRLLLFFLIGKFVYVYEEGLASYTLNLRPNNILHFFLKIFDFILCGAGWSGSSFINHGIYLYRPNSFIEIIKNDLKGKKIYSFNKKFMDHITQLPEIDYLETGLKFHDYVNQKVLLYITAGKVNLNVLPILEIHNDFIKILKLHPNEKVDDLNSFYFDTSINNTLPIELVILEFLKHVQKLVIVHESSAAMLNIVGVQGFTEFNIGEEQYKIHFEHIKNLFLTKG